MPRSLLIYNPAAGQRWRHPAPDAVLRALRERGWTAELLVTERQDHATALVRDNLTSEIDAVWVCGGDGTMGQAATALVGSDVPLGILPTGTVNVVAAECGIPSGVGPALDALTSRPGRRAFRAWRVGERAVMLGLGVGFEATVMEKVSLRTKRVLGFAAIGARGTLEWARYDFPALRVTGEDGDGRAFDFPATQALATLTRRFAGTHIVAPDADPEDGCIDLVLFSGRSRARMAGFWLGIQLPGTAHLRIPGVRTLRARRLRITSEQPIIAHINGDAVEHTPFDAEPWGPVQLLVPPR
ncbi:MAG TPA: diacylglycerol kinase family protein [Longimicrobium sp.]|jgi:diacylglycerol kinase family enzyme